MNSLKSTLILQLKIQVCPRPIFTKLLFIYVYAVLLTSSLHKSYQIVSYLQIRQTLENPRKYELGLH